MTATIETVTGAANTMVLNMGPQHPSTHGVLRVVLELNGEIVVKARPVIGYLHTGIEKNMEAKTYSQALTMTDRIDYLAPLSNNLCYCLAVEKILGLEIPKRAQYIRVLLTELTRIASHLVWLGTHAIDLGAMSVFLYTFREREEIMKIFEYVSGQRMMTSYFRIGGLALEPPPNWLDRVRRVIDALPAHIDEYEGLLTNNRIWLGTDEGRGLHERGRRDRDGRFRALAARAAALLTTCAKRFRTRATTNLISRSRRKRPAIASRVIRCASRKFARASRSSGRQWRRSQRKARSKPLLLELFRRRARK